MKITVDTAMKPTTRQNVLLLCEGAMMVALALILSYFKIQFLQAGSINFCMVPIILFAVRWGLGGGLLAGAAFGTLKFFLAEGFAINIWSFLLDYSVAYMFVGMAGCIDGYSTMFISFLYFLSSRIITIKPAAWQRVAAPAIGAVRSAPNPEIMEQAATKPDMPVR